MTAQPAATPVYRIHPGIGIARLGDSPDAFCISPERPAARPIVCDEQGNPLRSPDGQSEVTVTTFKDAQGRIKRQAARFQLYVYDGDSPCGRPLKLGDPIKGGGNHGVLVDIQWQVYLANKKAVWYTFDALCGEHGYDPDHPRRNADITDPQARQQLIIDPGPRIVDATKRRRASFERTCDEYAPVFPPELLPHSIDTLGELRTDDHGRLLVLGGHGNSGSIKRGFGQPRIDTYANNDGWFDDTSDGVVMARLVMFSQEVNALRYIDVEYPAWVIVGYPAYVPEILDIITLDDVIHDLAIRAFAERTDLYGEAGSFAQPQQIDTRDPAALQQWRARKLEWNPDYRPWFYRDVWPILFRADEMSYLTNVLEQSNYPHNQSARGNFDPYKLSVPPQLNTAGLARAKRSLAERHLRGELFVEALEPVLVLLDERLKSRHPQAARMLTTFEELREQLRDAAAAFALAASGGQPPDDPDAYQRRWREIYAQTQRPPQDQAALVAAYTKARQTLQSAIERALKVLKEVHRPLLAGTPPVLDALTLEAASRRPPPEEATEQTSPLSVEESFERCLSELRSGKLLEAAFEQARREHTYDYYRTQRMFLFDLLRQPNEENEFRLGSRPNQRTYHLPLMPLLAGDNPLTNKIPSKFLRLTDYQLFILRQWAQGKFFNEWDEGWVTPGDPFEPYSDWDTSTGRGLDRGVLMNLLGGAFCPGGEVGWLIRNPAIYQQPYRIKADPGFFNFGQTAAQANQQGASSQEYIASISTLLSQDSDFATGLQPGDLTKQMALPWQSDFNECSTQTIDVTYAQWNTIDPDSENDTWMQREQRQWVALWWPAHRPLQTFELSTTQNGQPNFQYLNWARGVPQTNAGDLKMVTEWSKLGFVIRNPYLPESVLDQPSPQPPKYISFERSQEDE